MISPDEWARLTYERDRRRITREARGWSWGGPAGQGGAFSNTRRRRRHGERSGIKPTRRFYPRTV